MLLNAPRCLSCLHEALTVLHSCGSIHARLAYFFKIIHQFRFTFLVFLTMSDSSDHLYPSSLLFTNRAATSHNMFKISSSSNACARLHTLSVTCLWMKFVYTHPDACLALGLTKSDPWERLIGEKLQNELFARSALLLRET